MHNLKLLRIKSLIGLFIFGISIISAYFYLNHSVLGLISITGMIVGWFLFSNNHTKLASIKIKNITNEYIKDRIKK